MFEALLVKLGLQAYASLIKVGLVVVTASLLFGSGWFIGYSHVKTQIKVERQQSIITQLKDGPIRDKIVLKTVGGVLKIHDSYVFEIPGLVEKNDKDNGITDCPVGADVIGLLNRNRSVPPLVGNDETGAAAATNK